jgi:dihydroflavonol-4-reductase
MVTLVTGGAGFIGRHLVRQLRHGGEAVRVLDAAPFAEAPAGVEVLQGDVTEPADLASALAGADSVFHLAALPQLWYRHPGEYERVNLGATRRLLEAAETKGVKHIVLVSSLTTLIGRRTPKGPVLLDETASPALEDMLGPYCRSKFLAEQAALEASGRGLPVVIALPTLPVGPGDVRLTPPSRMILDFLNARTPAFLETMLNLIDVEDLAAGLIAARDRGRIGERYILGHENLRLSELLGLLEELSGLTMPKRRVPYALALLAAQVSEFVSDRITGRPPKAPLTGVRLAGHPVKLDASKAMRELGLPQTPIRLALTKALLWFEREGLLERPLPNSARLRRELEAAPGRTAKDRPNPTSAPTAGRPE